MIIYKTTNLVNSKIYIGQDKNNNPKYLGSGDLIKRAIKKYGKNSFKKEILKECLNQKELDEYERFFIEKYNSRDLKIGYNISIGGKNGTTLNRNMSEETKKKISQSKIGVKFSKEHKKNLSEAHMGKKISEETKKKMSNSSPYKNTKKGNLDNNIKEKISLSKKGKKMSEETKKKMSETHKGIKNSFYGKKHTEETLLKMKKPIIQIDINDNFIKEWSGVNEAARSLGIRQSGISLVLSGKYKITSGFKFIYKND